jgi:hypothetical protein
MWTLLNRQPDRLVPLAPPLLDEGDPFPEFPDSGLVYRPGFETDEPDPWQYLG